MVCRARGLVFLAAALSACGSLDGLRRDPDRTPLNPTAVLETHVVNEGLKGFFPFEATVTSWTRADKRRDDSAVKSTGTLTGWFPGKSTGTRIERLDRGLVYTLDTKEKSFSECPLRGCDPEAVKAARPAKPVKPPEPECRLKIASTRFTVKPTGQKRNLNGFETDQYRVDWSVILRDAAGRRTVSTLDIDVWTTPPTPALKEATALEQAYAKKLAASPAPGAERPKAQLLPPEAARMINNYLSQNMSPADRTAFLDSGHDAEAIKGHAILTRVTWDMKGNACARKDTGAPGEKSSASAGADAPATVAEFFAPRKADGAAAAMADKPILSLSSEVMSHAVEPVHDSAFAPPRDYRRTNPK